FLGTGMCLYDLLTLDRNAGIGDRDRRIRMTQFMSRTEVLQLFPELDQPALSGGAIFADGQMYNAARLALAFAQSAAARGATVANYVRAKSFLWQDRTVRGVKAEDC